MADVFVVSGFPGAGKTSLCEKVIKDLKKTKKIELIRSFTTRPQTCLKDNYHEFVSAPMFVDMYKAGDFLEINSFNGFSYGTPRKTVQERLDEGISVILDVGFYGLWSICSSDIIDRDHIHSIFVGVDDAELLYERLHKRCRTGTEGSLSILHQLEIAVSEAVYLDFYDVVLMNERPNPPAMLGRIG